MILMKIDGIDGETQVKGHEKDMELHSLQHGVGIAISRQASNTTRTTSEPSFSEMTVTKSMDKASPKIFEACIKADGLKTIKIIQGREDKGEFLSLVEYELKDSLISGYSVSSGGDLPSESFSINYSEIHMNYIVQKEGMGKEGNVAVKWNVAKNAAA